MQKPLQFSWINLLKPLTLVRLLPAWKTTSRYHRKVATAFLMQKRQVIIVLQDVMVKEICFDYREAENDVAKFIKDWTNDGYDVEIFYDGSATTSVLLVAKKAGMPSRKRSKQSEKQEKEEL